MQMADRRVIDWLALEEAEDEADEEGEMWRGTEIHHPVIFPVMRLRPNNLLGLEEGGGGKGGRGAGWG